MSFNLPPQGLALCNGQLLPINQNQALFSLLGPPYGGDGRTTFGLPNLQGSAAVHMGGGFTLGQRGGEQAHVLTIGELPVHAHNPVGTTTPGDSPIPTGNILGAADNMYGPLANATSLIPATIANTGGSQAHENMQPYLVLSFCIALQGIFPSQN